MSPKREDSYSFHKKVTIKEYRYRPAEGSRNLRFPDFMSTAQNGGKVVSLTHRPLLLPENTPGTLLEVEPTPGP
jgi:hypothetical protein